MVIQENMSIQRKLEILSDAAKYDVACTRKKSYAILLDFDVINFV